MNKDFFTVFNPCVSAIAIVSLVSCSSSTEMTTISQTSPEGIITNLDLVDNSQWLFNEENQVYYQTGISYTERAVDTAFSTLSIFVPAAYMTATDNGDGTYMAELASNTKVGAYTASTAPIVIPIDTPGYKAMAPLTDYSSTARLYTDQGFVYVSAGLRGRDSGAPAGVTDAKAAIRYLRYNSGNIAGSTDNIFVYGMSGGGAQSAIIGASGDSDLYTPYLESIGAVAGVSDAVAGVMAWCPITNLYSANEAYEWNLGSSRTDLPQEIQVFSDGLAEAFASYLNELGIQDSQGNTLTLETSQEGIYQAGSYYDYLKVIIEDSLNAFLDTQGYKESQEYKGSNQNNAAAENQNEGPTEDHIQQEKSSAISFDVSQTYESVEDYINQLNVEKIWVLYDAESDRATITSIADFVIYMKAASKPVGSFDFLDRSQGENELFGIGDGGVHWDATMATLLVGTPYEEDFVHDLTLIDSLGNGIETRIDMYNPLYYLSDYYGGYRTATVANYWRIRTGISQADTALTTEVNLALALERYGVEMVDFQTIWSKEHVPAELNNADSNQSFIDWVHSIIESKYELV